jgi:hypothetical protein
MRKRRDDLQSQFGRAAELMRRINIVRWIAAATTVNQEVLPMSLGFETHASRKGATFARREMLDPINLVSKIMKEYPSEGINAETAA